MKEGVDSLLFATNNIATECLSFIRDKDIRVPDELGLIGFDGGLAFDFFYAPLSYVQQPVAFIAKKAVEIIVDEISIGSHLVQNIEVPGDLVIKASSVRTSAHAD